MTNRVLLVDDDREVPGKKWAWFQSRVDHYYKQYAPPPPPPVPGEMVSNP